MRLSTRNQLAATVQEMTEGNVMATSRSSSATARR